MLENHFPRLWVPTPENRDVRQLLLHRHRLVQMRTRVMNQLHAIAMNEGVRRKRGLWTQQGRAQLEALSLPGWTSRRRQELLELLDRFNPRIEELTEAIEHEAQRRPEVERLQTHPGVGPITALAYVLVLGTPERFACGKQVGSYLGLIPCEDSQRRSLAPGPHQQTRERAASLLAGAVGPERNSRRRGVATQICAPVDAPPSRYCEDRHGA